MTYLQRNRDETVQSFRSGENYLNLKNPQFVNQKIE